MKNCTRGFNMWLLLLFLVFFPAAYTDLSTVLQVTMGKCRREHNILPDQSFDYYIRKCRDLKLSLQCVKKTLEGLETTILFLYMEPEVDKITRAIEKTCITAKNNLCSGSALEPEMKECYSQYGITKPPQNMTYLYIKHHCSDLEHILNCMVSVVRVCPDDDHLSSHIEAISNWKEDLKYICGYNDGDKCSSYAVSEQMKTCFVINGIIDPPSNASETYIEKHCSQLEGTLTCLVFTVLSCPEHANTFPMTRFILKWRRHVERLCAARHADKCSSEAVAEKMENCLVVNGIGNLTTSMSFMDNHCSQLVGALSCLTFNVLRCPDQRDVFNGTLLMLTLDRLVQSSCMENKVPSTTLTVGSVGRTIPSTIEFHGGRADAFTKILQIVNIVLDDIPFSDLYIEFSDCD